MYVTPALFASRLEILARSGYNVLPLDAALPMLGEGSLPAKSVAITFDDGFHDFHELAFPILRRFGFPGNRLSNHVLLRPAVSDIQPGAELRLLAGARPDAAGRAVPLGWRVRIGERATESARREVPIGNSRGVSASALPCEMN